MNGPRKSALADLRIIMSISGKPDIDAVVPAKTPWRFGSEGRATRGRLRMTDHVEQMLFYRALALHFAINRDIGANQLLRRWRNRYIAGLSTISSS
jgi:hypothetical protein